MIPFAAFAPDWYFLLHFPIIMLMVGLVYSATRHDRPTTIFRETAKWLLRMGGFLVLLGVLLYVLSTYTDRWPYIMVPVAIGLAIYYLFTTAIGRAILKKLRKPDPTPQGKA